MKWYDKLMQDAKNRQFLPVYLLDGDEPFYIDAVTDYLAETILDESERDFNQVVLYGGDIEVMDIINNCRKYPMMAPYNVVIVKEAQNIKKFEELITYTTNPTLTTVLVVNFKHKKLDGKTRLAKDISKNGWYFHTEKLRDYQLPEWIISIGKKEGLTIAPKAAILLAEFLGDDLTKIVNTLKKVQIVLKGETLVDEKVVYRYVGISKEYNFFELQRAIINKDVYKSNLIIHYFAKNEKNYNVIPAVGILYGFFSKLLKYQFLLSKVSEPEANKQMGLPPFILKDYQMAAKYYPLNKVAKIISYLKDADLKAKGVNNSSISSGEIYKELIYKILH
jgi:DNA polymerase III subunit delta